MFDYHLSGAPHVSGEVWTWVPSHCSQAC